MAQLLNDLSFLFQRFGWTDLLDIILVAAVFFIILMLLRDTEALVLLRGVLFIIILLALFTSLVELPAFSWLISTVLPALVFAIPVIFAPEIRRAGLGIAHVQVGHRGRRVNAAHRKADILL